MAELSNALPLTARCLSPAPGNQIRAMACEKVASDLGELGGDLLLWYSGFLHHLHLASHK